MGGEVSTVSTQLRRREKLVAAVSSVLETLSPSDLRLRFGGAGAGSAWLLDALREDRDHRAYVARDGRRPVGVLDTARGSDAIEIGLAVAPSHRRRGIARRMLQRVLARADGEALPFVALCLPENRAVIALLRGVGFALDGPEAEYLRFVSVSPQTS
jgi:RimJ/RimL family protein N-acetyltransferase